MILSKNKLNKEPWLWNLKILNSINTSLEN